MKRNSIGLVKYIEELCIEGSHIQVLILAKLLLAAPATSERTFSTLRHIKTYLRSTMSNNRLNHNMVIHIHGQDDKEIDINAGMKEFIQKNDRRKYIFGMR